MLLKQLFLSPSSMASKTIAIYSEPIRAQGIIVKYRIVYLNVVVYIVIVSNIIHARTIKSGSSMLLTFEIMSQVKGIFFCREMPKSS